ncbi:MAG: hypothetical protein C4339_03340 [Nitrososphaerota archaeon]
MARQAARGASLLLLLQALRGISSVIFFALAARLLPRIEDYGQLSALTLVYNLYGLACGLGLPAAETYYMAQALGQGQAAEAAAVLRLGLSLGLGVSLAAAALNALLALPLAAFLLGDPGAAPLIGLLSLSLVPSSLSGHLYAALRAQRRFPEATSIEAIGVSIRNVGGVLLLWRLGLAGAPLGWALGDACRFVLYLWRTGPLLTRRDQAFGATRLLSYAAAPYANDLVSYVYGSVDRVLLLKLLGSRPLGLYTPAVTAALLVSNLVAAMGDALFPELSTRAGRGDAKGMARVSRLASRYLGLGAVPAMIGLASVATPTVTLFAGLRYEASAPVLAMVALSLSLTTQALIAGSLSLSLGLPRFILYSTLLGSALQAALSLALIPWLSLSGAALARALSALGSFLALLMLLARRWPVLQSIDWGSLAKAYIASIPCSLAALGLQLLYYGRYLLPAYISAGLVAYLLALRSLRVWREEDGRLLRELVGARAWRFARPLRLLAGLAHDQKG